MGDLRVNVARSVSLKIVIFLTCVALICGCAGVVSIATYATNSQVILRIAEQSFERSGIETINNTEYLLKPVAAAIDATATEVEDDVALIAKPSLSRFLYDIVALYPQVYSAYVSSADDGRFVQVQRIPPDVTSWGGLQKPIPTGTRFALRTVAGDGPARTDSYRFVPRWGDIIGSQTIGSATYDPRGRPFYKAASQRANRILTDIYIFASNGKPGVTIARRLEKDGQVIGVVAADITLEHLSQFMAAQPVGQHGIALIVDAEGRIVAAPPGRSPSSASATLREVGGEAVEEAWRLSGQSAPTFTFVSGGKDYIAGIRHFPADFDKNWTIVEVAPVDDFVGELKSTFRIITAFSLIVACVAGLVSLLVAGRITKPIDGLTAEADRIRSLKLDDPISGRSRIREIQHLIESMSAMKMALRTLANEESDQPATAALADLTKTGSNSKLLQRVIEQVEKRRARETELSLASDIQNSVLPRPDSGAARPASVFARMRPAREVGGDFYDWIWCEDGRLVFVVGDVSGKGIPAALLMTSTRTAIRSLIMAGASVANAVANANRLLSENNERCFFVTLFIGELDVGTGRLDYINAGHEPPRVLEAGTERQALNPGGPALGVIEEAEFETGTAWLRPGDIVVAYTDGVIDAVDATGERFGDDRVKTVLEDRASTFAPGIVDRMFEAVDRFAGDEQQFDDITCIVLHFGPIDSVTHEAA